jgi:hypothetical protein
MYFFLLWLLVALGIAMVAFYRNGRQQGAGDRSNDEWHEIPGLVAVTALGWPVFLTILIICSPGLLFYRLGHRRGERVLVEKRAAEAAEKKRREEAQLAREAERKLLLEQQQEKGKKRKK